MGKPPHPAFYDGSMERNRGGRPRHPDVLTPAEWRVLEALREGGTNAEIGARLGVSANTVRYHVSNMLAKLDLRDRRALAAWRPEGPRRRLGGVLALPAAVWSVGRPLAWVGVGAATLAGVAVVVVALVALEVIVEGDPDPPAAVAPPPATPVAITTPSPVPTMAPSPTPDTSPSPTPTAAPEGKTLRYDLLDVTGAVTAPGSYAILKTAGDLTSAVDNFGLWSVFGVELRVHPTDAAGVSRTAVYDAVRVGDRVDYRTNGIKCSFRFMVTSVPDGDPVGARSFGIEYVYQIGGWCGGVVEDPTAPREVEFVWNVPPGIPATDGGPRTFLPREPTGEGTYRLIENQPYVVDVPPGVQVIATPPFSDYGRPWEFGVGLTDVETGAWVTVWIVLGEVVRVTGPSAFVRGDGDELLVMGGGAEVLVGTVSQRTDQMKTWIRIED